MGVAQYNRGSHVLSRAADAAVSAAIGRTELLVALDDNAVLRERVRCLERDLSRARRCLASARISHDMRVAELSKELATQKLATSIVCRLAFPEVKP